MRLLTPVDAVDGGLILFGLTISLQDVQSILSIIIIVIDILWIVLKFVIKFFQFTKDGLDDDELNELNQDIEKIKDRIKEADKHE